VFARRDLKAQSSGPQVRQCGICAMRGNRGRKDTMRSDAARVCRYPAAYNEVIRCTGVKRRLDAAAGFDGHPRRGGWAGAAANSYRRIPLRLPAAAARRLRPYWATAVSGGSHGASQHGRGYAQETQPDRQNGCQPTHHSFRPPRPSCVDARLKGKFHALYPWPSSIRRIAYTRQRVLDSDAH
jgi:hypothetical protein